MGTQIERIQRIL